jgi:hypothetical protein
MKIRKAVGYKLPFAPDAQQMIDNAEDYRHVIVRCMNCNEMYYCLLPEDCSSADGEQRIAELQRCVGPCSHHPDILV